MNKKFFKEMFIIVLLLVVVIFTLGMLFYDSINVDVQKIDEAITEENSEDIDKLINETNLGNNKEKSVNISKSVSREDLENYRKQNSYSTGKKNPFSGVSDTNQNEDSEDIITNETDSQESTGRFFEKKSSK